MNSTYTLSGGVIAAPDSHGIVEDEKVIEARVAPTDIDQVTSDNKAVLRFPAFNQRTTTLELSGTVSVVASDVTKEPQSGVILHGAL